MLPLLQGSMAEIEKAHLPLSAWHHQAELELEERGWILTVSPWRVLHVFETFSFSSADLLRAESGPQAPSLASIPIAVSPGCPHSPINETHLELSIGGGGKDSL